MDALEYLARAGLRTRGSNKNAIAGASVFDRTKHEKAGA